MTLPQAVITVRGYYYWREKCRVKRAVAIGIIYFGCLWKNISKELKTEWGERPNHRIM